MFPTVFTPVRNGRQWNLLKRVTRGAHRSCVEAYVFRSSFQSSEICSVPVGARKFPQACKRHAPLVVGTHHCETCWSTVRGVLLVNNRQTHSARDIARGIPDKTKEVTCNKVPVVHDIP